MFFTFILNVKILDGLLEGAAIGHMMQFVRLLELGGSLESLHFDEVLLDGIDLGAALVFL